MARFEVATTSLATVRVKGGSYAVDRTRCGSCGRDILITGSGAGSSALYDRITLDPGHEGGVVGERHVCRPGTVQGGVPATHPAR